MLLLSVRAAENVGPLKNKTLYETANMRVEEVWSTTGCLVKEEDLDLLPPAGQGLECPNAGQLLLHLFKA